MRVKEIIKITHGKLLSGDPDIEIALSKISTDSRTINVGEFFLALDGANFNGSDFIDTAFKKGAIGALGMYFPSIFHNERRVRIKVKDSTKALQDIAFHHRMKFKIPVVAVTGSNGKTTVKEMLWKVLSTRYEVLKNEGTKNNHIGLPQTLLKLTEDHDICVLELGANHKGEIRNLANIARPTIALITNIGPSHLEFFHDLNGVYEAKKEIIESLDEKNSKLIINGDDEFLSKIKSNRFKIVKFGLKESNDFWADMLSMEDGKIKFILNEGVEFELNLLGIHNVYNALSAIVLARQFNIGYKQIKKAISEYRPSSMRLGLSKINGIVIMNDSYNSNPLSMRYALEAIKYYPARARWVVAGDMLELGPRNIEFHEMMGEAIAKSRIEGLLTFGKLSKYILRQAKRSGMDRKNLWHCSTHDEIANILKRVAKKGDAVLLKGSRSMRLEEVIEKLKAQSVGT